MIQSVVMVCTANICRSPIAASALNRLQPTLQIGSAGVDALAGHDMDPEAREAAMTLGLDVGPHRARQLDNSIGRTSDLILVMERHHRRSVADRWPHLLSKTFLIGEFSGHREIPDPYRRGKSMHIQAAELILTCAEAWSQKLESIRR